MESPQKSALGFLWKALSALLLAMLVFVLLRAIAGQSFRSQIILRAPESVFTRWIWPHEGWSFTRADLTLHSRPDWVLKDLEVEGRIFPKVWNLMLGCSSGSDMVLQGFRMTVAGPEELAAGLRELFKLLSAEKSKWREYLCQSTSFRAHKGTVTVNSWSGAEIPIYRLSAKKTESPEVQLDGALLDGSPLGVSLTYKPNVDTVVFTADFWNNALFDGRIESFLQSDQAFLTGELHCPPKAMTLGGSGSTLFSLNGTLSLSAEMSGHLSDLTAKRWSAETLVIEGALDARGGSLKPFNLAAQVLSETAQIPALTQLRPIIDGKALPKLFYLAETPFELMRFIISKNGRLVQLSRLMIKHSSYLAAGDGTLDPDSGTISFKGSLVLSDDLTRSLVKNVPRLDILVTDGGRLSLPFIVEGDLRNPQVHADIQQMTEKLITAYRGELIRRGNSRIEVSQ